MASYSDKLVDSLVTKIQLFLFRKSFEGEKIEIKDIENYISKIKDFEITNDLANLYSSTYYQTELKKDKKITLDENGNRKEISICESNLKSTKTNSRI